MTWPTPQRALPLIYASRIGIPELVSTLLLSVRDGETKTRPLIDDALTYELKTLDLPYLANLIETCAYNQVDLAAYLKRIPGLYWTREHLTIFNEHPREHIRQSYIAIVWQSYKDLRSARNANHPTRLRHRAYATAELILSVFRNLQIDPSSTEYGYRSAFDIFERGVDSG